MIGIYKSLLKCIQTLINLLFVVQITLMILVFLATAYWLFNLLGVHIFDFAKPLVLYLTDIVKIFYNQDVVIGGTYVDASILLFDFFAILIVYMIAKSKYYFHKANAYLNDEINNCEAKREDKFNKSLQKEVESNIKKCNNVAILVTLSAKNMLVDNCWGSKNEKEVAEKTEEAFKVFYASIKNVEGCQFAKTDDKMLIMLNDFSKVDSLLNFIDLSTNRIRVNMKRKKWLLITNIAIDVYDNKTNFKESVYSTLENLLKLGIKNEAVCLSNFCMRYDLVQDPLYTPFLRGKYNLGGETDVWSLVKKV